MKYNSSTNACCVTQHVMTNRLNTVGQSKAIIIEQKLRFTEEIRVYARDRD